MSRQQSVPFTPRVPSRSSIARPVPGELTRDELGKITSTLASVRKVRPGQIFEELEISGEIPTIPQEQNRSGRPDGTRRRAERDERRSTVVAPVANAGDTSAYDIEERSFLHQPLRSRVASAASSSKAGARNREEIATRKVGESRSRHKVNETDGSQLRLAGSASKSGEQDSAHLGRSSAAARYASRRDPGRASVIEKEEQDEPATSDAEDQTQTLRPKSPVRQLDGLPVQVQEAWIFEDLGYALQGVEGELFRFAESYDPMDPSKRLKGASWQIDRGIDSSLLSVVRRILPIATYYTAIKAFVDMRNATEFGMVNHALASGMRDFLKGYHHLQARLESLYLTNPDFTLQTAYEYLHQTLHTVSLIYALCLSLDFEDDSESDGSTDETPEDDDELAKELGLSRFGTRGALEDPDASDPKGLILGGEVLGILAQRAAQFSGDPTATAVHSDLLLHASQPYAKMLIQWIEEGVLNDPYKEFMVRESSHITKGALVSDYTDEYWERRYTLRDGSSVANPAKDAGSANGKPVPGLLSGRPAFRPGTNRLPGGAFVPPFLEAWKHKVLLAGKYLNVIKECGLEPPKPLAMADAHSAGSKLRMDDPQFCRRIESAYMQANETLLKVLLQDQDLLSHLRSMKHFFFLDQSEFLNQFLDNAASELRKPAKSASMTKIQSLLYMAVSNPASASSIDPHKEDLRVVLQTSNLFDWLLEIVTSSADTPLAQLDDGKKREDKKKELLTIDALALDFEVKFPLSLIISRKAITRYQLIFRFQLGLRYLELQLTTMWTEHKSPLWRKRINSPDMEKWKRRIFCLRAQMLQWVQHVLVFASGDVLETNWKRLEDKLGKVATVDQLLNEHVDYLDTCLKECMLTSDKLLNVTSKLMATINTFTMYQSSLTRILEKYAADPTGESDPAKIETRWGLLEKFESHFRHHVATHFDVVSYMASSDNPALLALVGRLAELRKANEDR